MISDREKQHFGPGSHLLGFLPQRVIFAGFQANSLVFKLTAAFSHQQTAFPHQESANPYQVLAFPYAVLQIAHQVFVFPRQVSSGPDLISAFGGGWTENKAGASDLAPAVGE